MLRIVTSKAEWDRYAAAVDRPSVCLSHDYVKAAELIEDRGARAELAVWEQRDGLVLHPYIRRPIPGAPTLFDLTSAYEFGGLWFSSRDEAACAAQVRAFAGAFAAHAHERGFVSEFMRVHPFTDGARVALGYEVRQAAQHTVVPLARPYAQLAEAYPASLRKALRKAERYELRIERTGDRAAFLSLYYANLARLGARRYYYFPEPFFAQIADALELYQVVDGEGRMLAAHLYLRDGDVLFAFLCHGVRERQDLRPNDFAYDQVIRLAAAAGRQSLHLGGGHPSLLRYKAKFAPDAVPFFIGRRIFDARAYELLTATREHDLGVALRASDFFPLYRANPPDPDRLPERNRADPYEAGPGDD